MYLLLAMVITLYIYHACIEVWKNISISFKEFKEYNNNKQMKKKIKKELGSKKKTKKNKAIYQLDLNQAAQNGHQILPKCNHGLVHLHQLRTSFLAESKVHNQESVL